MMIDVSTELSYLTVLPAFNINSNTIANSAGVNVVGFFGKLALIVSSGSGPGTTPVYTGYLQTGPNSNGLNAVNVNFTAVNGGNATVVSTFTTNNTNTVQVFGVDQRLLNTYLFVIGSLTGTNTPNVPLSVVIAGQKKVENS